MPDISFCIAEAIVKNPSLISADSRLKVFKILQSCSQRGAICFEDDSILMNLLGADLKQLKHHPIKTALRFLQNQTFTNEKHVHIQNIVGSLPILKLETYFEHKFRDPYLVDGSWEVYSTTAIQHPIYGIQRSDIPQTSQFMDQYLNFSEEFREKLSILDQEVLRESKMPFIRDLVIAKQYYAQFHDQTQFGYLKEKPWE